MSKMTPTELTPEREQVIEARVRRAVNKVAALPPPSRTETTCATAALAKKRAARLGMPNAEVGAAQTTHGWVGVVYLRPDQHWMAARVAEGGCRALPEEEMP